MTGAEQLEASGLTIAVGAASDIGQRRQLNEDSILVLPAAYIVADGMGGYEAGDLASQAVIDGFRQVATGREALTLDEVTRALELADDGVAAVAAATSRGAGSTVAGAVLVVQGGVPYWLVVNIGDSRVYRHAGEVLEQITVDHSLGQELFQTGRISAEEFAHFKDRNVITRAIGAAEAREDSWLMPVRTGERLLICSDGLTGELDDATLAEVLTRFTDPGTAATELIGRANVAGGRDNISVIIIDVLAGGADFDPLEATGTSTAESLDETTAPVEIRA